MKDQKLKEEINRIKNLFENKNVKNKLIVDNEVDNFISLYEKFNIKLDSKTISVLNSGLVTEQNLIDKLRDAFNGIGKRFRNIFQNKWAKKQGLPTIKELIENDQKNSPAVVNHPAYKDTIELMYKKKIKNATAILYWYYGEGYTGGNESPEDRESAQKLINIMKQLLENGVFTSDGFKKFVAELEKLFEQGIYVSLDVLGDTIGDDLRLSKFLKSQEKVAFIDVGSVDRPNVVKLTPAVKEKYDLKDDIIQEKNNRYKIFQRGSSKSFEVFYQKDDGKVSKEDIDYINSGYANESLDEKIFESLGYELKLLSSEGGVAVGIKFTDQNKISILDYVESSASEAGENILDAVSFDIQPENVGVDKGGIIEDIKTISEGETLVFSFQYPDKNDKEALKTSIYNDDNMTAIPSEGVQRITAAVQDAINSVTSNGFKIVGFGRYAGSTTSRVGTKYGSENGTTSEENNVNLAIDRCKAMNEVVDSIVSSSFPDIKIETTEDVINANQGPGWYSSKGISVNGPLYQQWESSLSTLLTALHTAKDSQFINFYRTDSAFAPINFYVYRLEKTYNSSPWTKEGLKKIIAKYKKNPSTESKTIIDAAQTALKSYQYPTRQQIQDEYESVYSQYRGSWITFGIVGTKTIDTPPKTVTIKDIQVTAHGDWVSSISFPQKVEKDRPKIEIPPIRIKLPKLKLKKIFKFKGLQGIPMIKGVKQFCEEAYPGADS
jgi:hypothetical protein